MSTPEMERVLTIRSELRESDQVIITVADSGPGIDPSIANRIFEPFFTTKAKGMGIGLAICRSIVEAHRGRFSIVQGVTRGAVLEIALPAANPKVDDGT
jgi:signal transduction histidine kinase